MWYISTFGFNTLSWVIQLGQYCLDFNRDIVYYLSRFSEQLDFGFQDSKLYCPVFAIVPFSLIISGLIQALPYCFPPGGGNPIYEAVSPWLSWLLPLSSIFCVFSPADSWRPVWFEGLSLRFAHSCHGDLRLVQRWRTEVGRRLVVAPSSAQHTLLKTTAPFPSKN